MREEPWDLRRYTARTEQVLGSQIEVGSSSRFGVYGGGGCSNFVSGSRQRTASLVRGWGGGLVERCSKRRGFWTPMRRQNLLGLRCLQLGMILFRMIIPQKRNTEDTSFEDVKVEVDSHNDSLLSHSLERLRTMFIGACRDLDPRLRAAL